MFKQLFLSLLLASMLPIGEALAAQPKSTFEIKNGHFYRNGKETSILSGEMHYARIPHQYWRHRLQMMKGMGLNTVQLMSFGTYTKQNQANGILQAIRIWQNTYV